MSTTSSMIHFEHDNTITARFKEGGLSQKPFDEYFELQIDNTTMFMTRDQAYQIKDAIEDYFKAERIQSVMNLVTV